MIKPVKNVIKINLVELEKTFGVPVVFISALKNMNVDKLIAKTLKNKKAPFFNLKIDVKSKDFTQKAYEFIDKNISNFTTKKQTKGDIFTEKVDNILLNRFFGIPIFFLIIFAIYYLSSKFGLFFGKYVDAFINLLQKNTEVFLEKANAKSWVYGLLIDGVFEGVGGVLSFLPQIIVLFTFISFLESSGYMARVAFLFDGFFSKLGLSGKSVIPFVLGSGCAVTGITATRIIEDERERKTTVILTPFLPCSAKTVTFGWFSFYFFKDNPFIATSIYFLSILTVVISCLILKKSKILSTKEDTFILELPVYRFNNFKQVLNRVKERVCDFMVRAGTLIFSVSVILWILKSFDFSFNYLNGRVEDSILFSIGSFIAPIFSPLGFGNWQSSVAILSGVFAKEAVIETFEIVATDISKLFANGFSAYAFIVFNTLSLPCTATLGSMSRELKNFKLLIFAVGFQLAVAYVIAFLINAIGKLYYFNSKLLFTVGFIIFLATMVYMAFRFILWQKCLR